MGTIYVEGSFRPSSVPVTIVGGQAGGSGLDSDILTNYVTKSELLQTIDNLTDSIEGLDHNVENEILILE